MARSDGRKYNELRKIKIKRGFLKFAGGSCLIECGNTKVICSATMEDKVPPFLRGQGKGWLTAEYGMLPASCSSRIPRPASRGKQPGRTHEIQRLIGRSLRAVLDFDKLGERTIWIDCDVIQGDGGTRTASITGAFVALCDLIKKKIKDNTIEFNPVTDKIAAVSVGVVDGKLMLDLCYEEDSSAEVDMNVAMLGSGKFVEIQGTAEGKAFDMEEFNKMIKLSRKGISEIFKMQDKAIPFSV